MSRTGTRGFTLIELMIVIAIIAIIAAIAIPNLLESRKAANEANAIQTLRAIHAAETLFRDRDYDKNGVNDYAQMMGPLDGLIPHSLLDDTRFYQGYAFGIIACDPGQEQFRWGAIAAPASPGKSGDRAFFIDETGVIRFSTTALDLSAADVPSLDSFLAWEPLRS
jgi:prepilin-type N-terminal cleavage/methylation domain-containing protein